jgi:hypothetical protein
MMVATSHLRSMPNIKGKWATGLIRCTVIAMMSPLCIPHNRPHHSAYQQESIAYGVA